MMRGSAMIAALLCAFALHFAYAAQPVEELQRLISDQDILITQLYARVAELSAERDAMQEVLRAVNSSDASSQSVEGATHATLRRETYRLSHKLSHLHPESVRGDLDAEPWSRSQQVSVTCSDARVSLTALDREDEANGVCMVLSVVANNLNSRFVMHCEPSGEEDEAPDPAS
jgi:hypothetical protein